MNGKSEQSIQLFWLSLLFYSSNILNMYLTIKYLQAGELLYFIIFWSFFVIDKIITLMTTGFRINDDRFIFWIFDVFQLGSFYILFKTYLPFGFDGIIITKLFARVFPLMITESIIFFGFGIINENKQVDDYIHIMSYLNFILFQVIAIIFLYSILEKNEKKGLFSSTVNIFSTFLVQAALFGLKDNFGVCLGYYGYIAFSLILTLITFLIPYRESQILQRLFFSFISQIPIDLILRNKQLFQRYYYIAYYMTQFIKIALLFIFGMHVIIDDINNFSSIYLGTKIQIINYILAASFGVIQVIDSIPTLYSIMQRVQVHKITSITKLKRANEQLSIEKGKLASIYVIFDSPNRMDHHLLLQEHNEELIDCKSEICCLNQEYFTKLWMLQQQDVIINVINCCNKVCEYHYVEMMKSSQFLIRQENFYLSYEFKMDKINYADILIERVFNGFSLKDNNEFKYIIRNLTYNQSKIIYLLLSDLSSIIAYTQQLSSFMPILPSQILYDLYQ